MGGSKLRVGVDICNTISNVNLELLRYYNVSIDDYPSTKVPEGFFITGKGLGVLMHAEPFPGSQNILKRLQEEGNVIEYVTTRPVTAEFVTKRWLVMYGFPQGKVIFVHSHEEKAACAVERNYTVFFEDDPRAIKSLLDKGVEVFVKDWPYNRSNKHDMISRFKRWSDVVLVSGARLGM
jgi:hypothetical protein